MTKNIGSITESLVFLSSPSRSFSLARRLARGRSRQAARPAVSDRAGLGVAVLSASAELRRLLRGLRNSLSDSSPQRRSAEVALSLRLPAAPSAAACSATKRRLLSNARGKTPQEASQCPPSEQASCGHRSAAAADGPHFLGNIAPRGGIGGARANGGKGCCLTSRVCRLRRCCPTCR